MSTGGTSTIMIPNKTGEPGKPAAVRVIKICLAVATVVGTLVFVLRLIKGEPFFEALFAVAPLICTLAVAYWLVLPQKRAAHEKRDGPSQQA